MKTRIDRRHWLAAVAAVGLCGPTMRALAATPTLLVLGDSLSAEYGLKRDSGWVRLLGDRLNQNGAQYSVVNASISGETTSGGRTRLASLLERHRPAIVIIELGANDGLRGLPLAQMRENLRTMIQASQKAGARVLLVGMRIPPNYGREYSDRFASVYVDLARSEKAALVPFFFDGFADQMDFFQTDRIHPNENAQQRMLDLVWPQLRPLLVRNGG
jgi:acyl-CoA thioesterase I